MSEVTQDARKKTSAGFAQALLRFWFGPVDPIRLEIFRRLFGFSLLLYMLFRFRNGREWLTSHGFHMTAESYYPSLPPPGPLVPEWLVPWLAIFTISCICLWIIGWKQRVVAVILVALQIYLQRVDYLSAYTLNKLFILGTAVLACAPKPVLVVSDTEGQTELVQSAWALRVLQLTLVIQYFTAGTSKVFHGDWHLHADTLWTHAQGTYCTEIAAWMLRTLPMWAWTAQMYASLAFELLAFPLFCIKRLRPLGIVWGLGFHIVIALTMYNLFYFSFQMVTFYVLFLDPGLLHAVNERVRSIWPRREVREETMPIDATTETLTQEPR